MTEKMRDNGIETGLGNGQKGMRFSGYHLKMIALITMVIDHVAAVFLWRVYEASYSITGSMQLSNFWGDQLVVWVSKHQELVFSIYEMMRYIGRMAFPIYCFLLVEGFLHTGNVKKYALRLLGFAFVSEIPFDLALTGTWWSSHYSNVFFTLVLGLLSIWLLSYVEKLYEFWQEKQLDSFLGTLIVALSAILILAVFGGIAEMVLFTDYGLAGVVAIMIFYLFRRSKEMAFVLAVFALSALSSNTELLALCMLFPLMRYDGSRGKSLKYVFYVFYPAHLLVLALLCIWIGV